MTTSGHTWGPKSRVFEALFDGPCENAERCDGIKKGDSVFFGSQMAKAPQHLPGECHYTDELAAKRVMCERCRMETLPSGRCPNGCDE